MPARRSLPPSSAASSPAPACISFEVLRVKKSVRSAASERIANGAPITTTSRAAGKVADEWSQEHKPDDDETV
jgi:hypothetical protein